MSYVQPDTNIRLLTGIPLDKNYRNTLFWYNASSQQSYFSGKTKYSLTGYSFQRVTNGVLRVGLNSEKLYNCNYMMFQNTAFGNRWFYAFIDSVDYINNITSEIHFTLDVMQTWFFDYTQNYCFVERNHSSSDKIGDNIVAEPVNLGEYVYNNDYYSLGDLSDYIIVVSICDMTKMRSNMYEGIFGASTLYLYHATQAGRDAIRDKIADYEESPDSILSVYMMPTAFYDDFDDGDRMGYGEYARTISVKADAISKGDSLDGYTPKNAKMYTYPYNFWSVDNAAGSSLSLRYEFFTDLKPKGVILGTVTQPVQAMFRPVGYKNTGAFDYAESITLDNYPICSWSVDSYNAWVAQNGVSMATNMLGGAGSAAFAGAAVGGVLGAGVGAAGSLIASAISAGSSAYKASIAADIVKGNPASGNINVAHRTQQFYGGRMSVTSDYAKSIDQFFTMFGYAQNKVMKPVRDARPEWTYVKTAGCSIGGSLPADDETRICSVYDNGVTFWKTPEHVGNYGLDNTV